MSNHHGERQVLSLPKGSYPEATAELFCQRIANQARSSSGGRVINHLNLIVNISPAVEPDDPLPAPWGDKNEPLYFLDQSTQQPIVINGVVWSYYADGSGNRLQRFSGGIEIGGGKPIQIWNGVVNMHTSDGCVLVFEYRLGRCLSVTNHKGRA
jgi:hypothetical protein